MFLITLLTFCVLIKKHKSIKLVLKLGDPSKAKQRGFVGDKEQPDKKSAVAFC